MLYYYHQQVQQKAKTNLFRRDHGPARAWQNTPTTSPEEALQENSIFTQMEILSK
jgi:hypothetical protein